MRIVKVPSQSSIPNLGLFVLLHRPYLRIARKIFRAFNYSKVLLADNPAFLSLNARRRLNVRTG